MLTPLLTYTSRFLFQPSQYINTKSRSLKQLPNLVLKTAYPMLKANVKQEFAIVPLHKAMKIAQS
jgi:hypothetical protein